MKAPVVALSALLLAGCATFQPRPVTFAPACEKNLQVEGTDKVDRINYMARLACMDLEEATGRELHRMPPVHLRVYGAGEAPKICGDHRSGTCTRANRNGSYSVEVRKPTHEEVRQGRSMEGSALHELRHVALFELKPELCEDAGDECSERHHREMYRLHVCQPDMCDDSPKFKFFGD